MENSITLATTSKEAAVLLFRLGFTPIKVVGKNPAFGEGAGWQKTHYSSEADVAAHFQDWNGTQMVPDETDDTKIVERGRNVGVLCNGFVFVGSNTQEMHDAFTAVCPFYNETLQRMGNNPYAGAIFKRTDPEAKFWSGQKIITDEKKPKTMGDIWGDGNQFVAWGTHPAGIKYRFINNCPIIKINTADAVEMVAAALRKMGNGYKLKTPIGKTVGQKFVESDFNLFSAVKKKVRMSEILGTTDKRILCPLHKQGTSNPAAVIYEEPDGDQLHCHSSGCHADVITLYARKKGIGSNLQAALELAEKYGIEVPREISLSAKDEAPKDEEELVTKLNGLVQRARVERKTPDRGKIVEVIGHFLYEKEKFKTPSDTQVLYIYSQENGIYVAEGEVWVHTKVQQYMDKTGAPELISCHLSNEVVGVIKRLTYISREDLEPPVRYTPMANGIYDFASDKLLPFTPELFFTSKIAAKFNPDAKCPVIDKFFSEITCDGEANVLYEVAGYSLQRSNPYQKAWLFDGTGNNGKSLYIHLLEKMIGKDNCCSVPIQKLEANRFAAAEMEGKYLNSVADLSGADLKSTGTFKAIVGGDMIQAERKGQNPFRFYPWAKLVYSCNKVPDSGEDDSNAFYRRWILITFPNDFSGREDRKLEEKITVEEEVSGLVNVGLAAMRRINGSGEFTGQKSVEDLRKLYVSKSNSAKAFLSYVIHDPEAVVAKSQVWKEYFLFCKKKNLTTKSEKAFWQELKPHFDCDGKKTLNGVKDVRVVRGLKLSNSKEDIDNSDNIDNIDTLKTYLNPAVGEEEEEEEGV